jgi:MSHA biogenesis protein MshI
VIQLFKRPLARTGRTAVLHTPAVAATAVVDSQPGARPRLLHLAVNHADRDPLPWTAAQTMLRKQPHRETPVTAVMPPGSYQLLQMDAAEVPAAELRDAMRWRLRDVIDKSPENMMVDVLPLPARSHTASSQQVFVVAAEQKLVDEQAAMVAGAARTLDVIDIPELALRNLMSLVPGESAGCALLLLGRGYVQILVSRNGSLHVVRRIDGAALTDADRIAVHVQRSLQFYEAHFDGAPINTLRIAPDNELVRELTAELGAITGLTVEPLVIGKLLDCEGDCPLVDEPESLLALGAALRPTGGQAP